jgi:hypothetical protein
LPDISDPNNDTYSINLGKHPKWLSVENSNNSLIFKGLDDKLIGIHT